MCFLYSCVWFLPTPGPGPCQPVILRGLLHGNHLHLLHLCQRGHPNRGEVWRLFAAGFPLYPNTEGCSSALRTQCGLEGREGREACKFATPQHTHSHTHTVHTYCCFPCADVTWSFIGDVCCGAGDSTRSTTCQQQPTQHVYSTVTCRWLQFSTFIYKTWREGCSRSYTNLSRVDHLSLVLLSSSVRFCLLS